VDKELVESRGIRWIRYDDANRTLDVAYTSSGEYRYFDVEREVYEWLRRAQSKGKFVSRLVKSKYRYERLTEGREQPPEGGDLEQLLEQSLHSRPKSTD
jgi:KTSC domain